MKTRVEWEPLQPRYPTENPPHHATGKYMRAPHLLPLFLSTFCPYTRRLQRHFISFHLSFFFSFVPVLFVLWCSPLPSASILTVPSLLQEARYCCTQVHILCARGAAVNEEEEAQQAYHSIIRRRYWSGGKGL
ncbi:hypothetical protein, unlikely [Trypanosoma brucei gambiense DAL972]|uniref:Uncharacterized protein n=1 Tax=Trypanosoma brucei gambiense (strain MHOM/CI/86/DAL972) TaxID=679716 RepID=C9ZJY2_TRYB9|nr:hypothetical protein, unlikely [Trypanosoma brucei gambiense DAL972]CBH09746.1 hypothetical protein, unlikely [Trypanosoma brucei gambiense DAL972]|eukprot:XP_011772039.1 hypothetical protein, unlikely [Trypanosoma brucei gambiense DAL972]